MSNRILNIINVVDLEATCWDAPIPPAGQQSEIIEVGIVVVDATKRNLKIKNNQTVEPDDIVIRDKTSYLIKPTVSKVSPFCTKLTTITADMLADAPTFDYVCNKLRYVYESRNRLWASYGDYDRKMFDKQCNSFRVPYPFGPRHMNIKNLFAVLNGMDKEVGMPDALAKIDEKLDGTHHRGHDDAENIAKILKWILLRFSSG